MKQLNLLYRKVMFYFSNKDMDAILKYDPLDILQESEDKKQWLKQKRKNLSVMINIVSVMVRPHTTMKKRGLYD